MTEWKTYYDVCSACFADDSLRRVVVAHEQPSEFCSFCEEERSPATPLDLIVEHIQNCLFFHYEDAAESLPWDGEEGRYFGPTYETQDVLEQVGLLDALTDSNQELFDAICNELGDQTWTDRDPLSMREGERLDHSWQKFSEYIKHHRRFFFLDSNPKYAEFDGGDTLLGPGSLLARLVEFSVQQSLITTLPQGTALYRVRQQRRGERFASPLDLGAPPPDRAQQTNRMSPPGVAMTYLAQDESTALAETGTPQPKGKRKTFAVATFALSRDIAVLDLSNVPDAPSIFDLDGAPHYDTIHFLRHFAAEVSKPIARDEHVHIDYVPTQVVTEYFRDAKHFVREAYGDFASEAHDTHTACPSSCSAVGSCSTFSPPNEHSFNRWSATKTARAAPSSRWCDTTRPGTSAAVWSCFRSAMPAVLGH